MCVCAILTMDIGHLLDTRGFHVVQGGNSVQQTRSVSYKGPTGWGKNVARTIRDANLEKREGRHRLPARGKPHYRLIEPGLHLGYRKPSKGAGKWVVRHYAGG